MTNFAFPTRGLARLGIVVPVTNTNLEPDMAMLAPDGVSLHYTRAGGYDVDEIPDEEQMKAYSDSTPDALIEDLRLCRADIVLYGCTSATLAQGPDYDARFRQRIEAIAGVPAVTAASALVEVLQGIGVRRFAFTSPYVATLNDLALAFLESFDMVCVARRDAPEPMSNDEVAATTPDEIIAIAKALDCDAAEAMVISCTDYRATEAIPVLEAALGKPVVTSNQATLLVGLRRLGIDLGDSPLQQHLATRDYLGQAV